MELKLQGSGYTLADSPALELYDTDFVVDEKTGAFTCWLCLPVKAG
jgi:AraC family transcriptional regulator